MRQSSDITLLFSTFNGFFQCTSKDSTWIKSSGKKKVTAERIEYWYWLNDLIRIYVALIKSMPIPMESTVPFFLKKKKISASRECGLVCITEIHEASFFLFQKVQSLYWLKIGYSRKVPFCMDFIWWNQRKQKVFFFPILDMSPCLFWMNTVRLNGCPILKGPCVFFKKNSLKNKLWK